MDGNSNTIILNYTYHIAFALDYVQQVLYWMRFDSCTLESLSSVDGTRRRSYEFRCDPSRYTVSIDFLRGAIYSYSYKTIAKIVIPTEDRPIDVSSYSFLSNHMSSSYSLYTRLKVISYERQKQGTSSQ